MESWLSNVTGKGIDNIRRAAEKQVAKVDVKADTTNFKRDIERVTHDDPGLFTIEVDAKTKKAKAKRARREDAAQSVRL